MKGKALNNYGEVLNGEVPNTEITIDEIDKIM